jgi:SAM-dependent methyltransferase
MNTAEQILDTTVLESFGGKVMSFLNGGMAALMMSVGHRTGLFDAMAVLGPSTSVEIAEAASRNERYVREWLGAMFTAGVVEYDSNQDAYRLPAEHAAMTTRPAGVNNFAIFTQMIAVCAGVEDQIVERFENGGGVPYSQYPRFHDVVGEYSAAVFDTGLVNVTLPLVPEIVARLEGGIDVADIGAGRGHAVNVMARAFPKSRFTAIDFSADALAVGKQEADIWGLDNVSFVVKDAATLDESVRFDFVTTFDAVHDQADPLRMVRGVHQALVPGGYWLCVDIGASSKVRENIDHPMGPFLYGLSCMHCMSVSLAYDGVGLGAMWGEQRALELFSEAGFSEVQVEKVPDDPFNNYYICRKAL